MRSYPNTHGFHVRLQALGISLLQRSALATESTLAGARGKGTSDEQFDSSAGCDDSVGCCGDLVSALRFVSLASPASLSSHTSATRQSQARR
jgi:hypothetical protein